jgi:uncharacterized protein (DUF488 family)
MPLEGLEIFTLGTSSRSFEEFLDLLREHAIEAVVDIRSFPTSRYPHFGKAALQQGLESEGVRYHYLGKELGGFRKGGYVAYMETEGFRRGIERLEDIGRNERTAFFCSERFPWKCHRRWVAQQLTQRGWHIIHIIDPGKIWIPKQEVGSKEVDPSERVH